MRLVQLRDWLAGQGWYDLRQYGVAVPLRVALVAADRCRAWRDALGFRLVRRAGDGRTADAHRMADAAAAADDGGAAAVAWRIAGREAALVALLMAVIGLPAFHQFRPGRIDHHNLQIALSLLAVAATVWSDRVRWAAVARVPSPDSRWRSDSSACRISWCAAQRSRRAMRWMRSPRGPRRITGWRSRSVRCRRFSSSSRRSLDARRL